MKNKIYLIFGIFFVFGILALSAFFYLNKESPKKDTAVFENEFSKEGRGVLIAVDKEILIFFDEKEGVEKRLKGSTDIYPGSTVKYSYKASELIDIALVGNQEDKGVVIAEVGYVSMKYNYIAFVVDKNPKALLWDDESVFEVTGKRVSLQDLKDGMIGKAEYTGNLINSFIFK